MMAFSESAFAILVTVALVKSEQWSYGNFSQWPGLCQTGTMQSPINIVDAETYERIYSAFEFTNYDEPHSAKVKNNGHSVAITLNKANPKKPTISGAGLTTDYVLDHFHFHWQSEHTVDGYRYPLEMHLVHHSTKYGNLSQASAFSGGIAVLGVLFDISLDDDKDFVPLIEVMKKVEQFPDVEVDLEEEITARSFLPRNTADYYRYHGSLTTPACNEGVIWTIFEKTLPISADQIEHFQSVWSKEGPLTLNYRPVQKLNERMVTVRKSPRRLAGGSASSVHPGLLFMITFLLPFISTKLY